jgi:hypothetical protein
MGISDKSNYKTTNRKIAYRNGGTGRTGRTGRIKMKKLLLLFLIFAYSQLSASPPYSVKDNEQRLVNEDIYYKLNKLSIRTVAVEKKTDELGDIYASDVITIPRNNLQSQNAQDTLYEIDTEKLSRIAGHPLLYRTLPSGYNMFFDNAKIGINISTPSYSIQDEQGEVRFNGYDTNYFFWGNNTVKGGGSGGGTTVNNTNIYWHNLNSPDDTWIFTDGDAEGTYLHSTSLGENAGGLYTYLPLTAGKKYLVKVEIWAEKGSVRKTAGDSSNVETSEPLNAQIIDGQTTAIKTTDITPGYIGSFDIALSPSYADQYTIRLNIGRLYENGYLPDFSVKYTYWEYAGATPYAPLSDGGLWNSSSLEIDAPTLIKQPLTVDSYEITTGTLTIYDWVKLNDTLTVAKQTYLSTFTASGFGVVNTTFTVSGLTTLSSATISGYTHIKGTGTVGGMLYASSITPTGTVDGYDVSTEFYALKLATGTNYSAIQSTRTELLSVIASSYTTNRTSITALEVSTGVARNEMIASTNSLVLVDRQLQIDLSTEVSDRIIADNVIKISTGSLDTAKLDKSSATATYLFKSGDTMTGGLTGTNNLLFNGGSGAIPVEGAGTRLMWYPAKQAFRSGYVSSTGWDDVNIGQYSTAVGYNSIASGLVSVALGEYCTASGEDSFACGDYTTASGRASTAMGQETNATALQSFAAGYYVTASSQNTFVFGKGLYGNHLTNNIADTFMIGFNRAVPTFTVFQSSTVTDGIAYLSTITVSGQYVHKDGTVQTSTTAYLGATQKATDSDKWDGVDSTSTFVSTHTANTLSGQNTFTATTIFSSATFSGNVSIGDTGTGEGKLEVKGNIVPRSSLLYDLGSSGRKFLNAFIDNVNIASMTATGEITSGYGFFHERDTAQNPMGYDFNVSSFSATDAWRDLSLAPYIPVGTKTVLLRVIVINSVAGIVMRFCRDAGVSTYNKGQIYSVAGNYNSADIIVSVDANRGIDYYLENYGTWSTINVTVAGWWK